ncbi:hypothetical protein [Actinomadura parmotrematis]|uniref:Uncharacterized protein n=1 Tax=Actinomadura parmotrematis TaxID=2864039 RepID=A0ABS7G3W7_9ACTN|nr:hypothetical protein [Actinomadura parmotrematis]MBW8487397.1 hypothetical protein [Actinomadura parmotrematis]
MITVEHVERLLDSADPDAALVVVGGAAKVVSGAGDDAGYVVTDRADLVESLAGRERTPEVLEVLARELDTAVGELGG